MTSCFDHCNQSATTVSMNTRCQVSSGIQEFFQPNLVKKKMSNCWDVQRITEKLCGAKLKKIINLKKVVGVQLSDWRGATNSIEVSTSVFPPKNLAHSDEVTSEPSSGTLPHYKKKTEKHCSQCVPRLFHTKDQLRAAKRVSSFCFLGWKWKRRSYRAAFVAQS